MKSKKGFSLTSILGILFLVLGFVFLAYPSLTTTGNVVLSNQDFVNSDAGFLVAVASMLIGGVILIKSLK